MEEFQYPFREIEQKWRGRWEEEGLYRVDLHQAKNPYYTHVMFPYPSGDTLHIGHVYNYAPADAFARFMRMKGHTVFSPMGFDAFGLPAENHAIKNNVNPATQVAKNIELMSRQLKRLGCMYDWSKELRTCDENYYRWGQWIFLLMYKRDLAHRKPALVNFCPSCQTVLANEQAKGGRCERCGSLVVLERRLQWTLDIRKYAQKMLDNFDPVKREKAGNKPLNWPDKSRRAQEEWIGRSDGVNFNMRVKDLGLTIKSFDSIPQTFLAQTYTVIAPDHELLPSLVAGTEYEKPVMEFALRVNERRKANPYALDKEIEGVFTGRYVENPFGTGDFPIWVASYAKADYATGIVNCSAHDQRDFNFAKKFGIPLRVAMVPPGDEKRAERVRNLAEFYGADKDSKGRPKNPDGVLLEPPCVKGWRWDAAEDEIIRFIVDEKFGEPVVQYRIKDWGISRQRYWGTPIPMVYDPQGNVHPIPEQYLPWRLPQDVHDFKPTGKSPLGKSQELIERTERIFGKGWRPELDTMDTFVDSAFYSYRYLAEGRTDVFVPLDVESKWMPVQTYIGGAEHATKHLIYARFVSMVLHDAGVVQHDEPYEGLVHQGLVQGEKEFHVFYDPERPTTLVSLKERVIKDAAAASPDKGEWVQAIEQIRDPSDLEEEDEEIYGAVPSEVPLVGLMKRTGKVVYARRVGEVEFYVFYSPGEPTHIFGADEVSQINEITELSQAERTAIAAPSHAALVGRLKDGGVVFGRRIDRELAKSTMDKEGQTYTLRSRDGDAQIVRLNVPAGAADGGGSNPGAKVELIGQSPVRLVAWTQHAHRVEKSEGEYRLVSDRDIVVDARSFKMSKSRGNAESPDPIMDKYGTDVFRLGLMSIGKFKEATEWSDDQVRGSNRLVRRIWQLFSENSSINSPAESEAITREVNRAVDKVGRQLKDFEFHNAIASLNTLMNEVEIGPVTRSSAERIAQLLAPLAPHLAEELWRERLGHTTSVFDSRWPDADSNLLVDAVITIGVQVAGKARGRVAVPRDAAEDDVIRAAVAVPDVAKYLPAGYRKAIVVKNKIINLIPN